MKRPQVVRGEIVHGRDGQCLAPVVGDGARARRRARSTGRAAPPRRRGSAASGRAAAAGRRVRTAAASAHATARPITASATAAATLGSTGCPARPRRRPRADAAWRDVVEQVADGAGGRRIGRGRPRSRRPARARTAASPSGDGEPSGRGSPPRDRRRAADRDRSFAAPQRSSRSRCSVFSTAASMLEHSAGGEIGLDQAGAVEKRAAARRDRRRDVFPGSGSRPAASRPA